MQLMAFDSCAYSLSNFAIKHFLSIEYSQNLNHFCIFQLCLFVFLFVCLQSDWIGLKTNQWWISIFLKREKNYANRARLWTNCVNFFFNVKYDHFVQHWRVNVPHFEWRSQLSHISISIVIRWDFIIQWAICPHFINLKSLLHTWRILHAPLVYSFVYKCAYYKQTKISRGMQNFFCWTAWGWNWRRNFDRNI